MNTINFFMGTSVSVAACAILGASAAQAQEERHTIACSAEQENAAFGYQTYAGLQLLTASNYIGSVKRGTGDPKRFDYWFGNHDTETVAAVERMMSLIYYSTMEDAQYRCDCAADTDPNVVAYVFPSDADRNVFLCAPFFSQSATNVWTVGVVSHELSHFNGTTDFPYGGDWLPNSPAAAHQVALDDPELTINTSYNYQFFLSEQVP